jgi:hypothetical protein
MDTQCKLLDVLRMKWITLRAAQIRSSKLRVFFDLLIYILKSRGKVHVRHGDHLPVAENTK